MHNSKIQRKVTRGRGNTKNKEKRAQDTENKIILGKICFTRVGKGKKHICTNSERHGNVVNIIKKFTPKTQEQVVSSVLKTRVLKSNNSSSSRKNASISLTKIVYGRLY